MTIGLNEALRREYAQGLSDGVEMTLTLSLGRNTHGGVPYFGELPDDFIEWAETALARVKDNP